MKILITIDPDESASHYILREAIHYVRAFPHAEVHIFTVWDLLSATAVGHAAVDSAIMEGFRHRSEALVRDAVEIFGDRPFTFHSEVGEPADEIERQIERIACDLLIMGTHGRTGINHLLMGSVAEKMLRLSRCNTLVIPIKKKLENG